MSPAINRIYIAVVGELLSRLMFFSDISFDSNQCPQEENVICLNLHVSFLPLLKRKLYVEMAVNTMKNLSLHVLCYPSLFPPSSLVACISKNTSFTFITA